MKSLLIYAMLVSTASAISVQDVPMVQEVDYVASARDPFVDSSVSPTLLGATGERDLRKIGPPIESYRGELEALLRQSSKVDGVAVANGTGFSVVNGKVVKKGMPISIAIPDELCERLLLTSRYFGLGLEDQISAKHLNLSISRITSSGLLLTLQGMKADLHLPYQKNLSPR